MYKASRFENKIFVIYKSRGPTSFEIVKAFRSATKSKKVGHAGTLDPLAEGVLLLATDKATRAAGYLMDLEKTYEFEAHLGVGTTTLDSEGSIVEETECPSISESEIIAIASSFIGEYEQAPPVFSALKKSGKPLYELARKGQNPFVHKRAVRIYGLDVLGVSLPLIRFCVTCSRGTYIRALARDFGKKLNVPAHVTRLLRSRIGPFDLEGAFPDELLVRQDVSKLEGIELSSALSFLPAVVVNERSSRALLRGALPDKADVVSEIGGFDPGKPVRIINEEGVLFAVGRREAHGSRSGRFVVDSYKLFVNEVN